MQLQTFWLACLAPSNLITSSTVFSPFAVVMCMLSTIALTRNTLWNSLSSWKEPNMPTRKFEVALREPMLHLKNAVIIDLHGEINGTVEAALTVAYEQAEIQDPEMIILNFTDVDYINSTGIAL